MKVLVELYYIPPSGAMGNKKPQKALSLGWLYRYYVLNCRKT
jgi:hypothetical protein